MWFAVETAFIDGEHFTSRPCFSMDADPEDTRRVQPGTCLCGHDECPHNSCETFMDGRIEVHVDWFKTKEQAMKFCDGSLAYVIYQRASRRTKNGVIRGLPDFVKWEAVDVDEKHPPFRGIYKDINF